MSMIYINQLLFFFCSSLHLTKRKIDLSKSIFDQWSDFDFLRWMPVLVRVSMSIYQIEERKTFFPSPEARRDSSLAIIDLSLSLCCVRVKPNKSKYTRIFSAVKMGSTQTKIDTHVYQSIAKYTQMKPEEVSALQEHFLRRCDPGSKTMTKEQFCQFYQQLRSTENVKRLSENIFRAFDANNDHGISFSEVRPFHLVPFCSVLFCSVSHWLCLHDRSAVRR